MLFSTALNTADNSWQLTAATLVGLMSVPGLVVLYGGVMQKRWSVNSMMLAFSAFAGPRRMGALRLRHGLRPSMAWALQSGLFGNFIGSRRRPESDRGGGPGGDSACRRPRLDFPQSSLVYFQFVFAAITPS